MRRRSVDQYGRTLTASPVTAYPLWEDASQPSQSTSAHSTAFASDRLEIRLQRAEFDPLVQAPALPAALSRATYPGDGTGYYLVQFRGPILPEWKAALQQAGVTVFDYVPQFAYIVKMNNATAARISALNFVRWVGVYQPAFRLSTDLDQALTAAQPETKTRLTVRAFAGESDKALLQQLTPLGASVQAAGEDSGGGAISQAARSNNGRRWAWKRRTANRPQPICSTFLSC